MTASVLRVLNCSCSVERRPGNTVDLVVVLVEGGQDAALRASLAVKNLFRVPDNDGLVAARACKKRARGSHRHALDPVRVPLRERLQAGAAEGVPDADGLVARAGKQEVGVRGQECQARHFVLVARQGFLHGERLQVPELNRHVCRARGEQLAVLVEGQELDGACVAFERAFVFALLEVPQSNRGIFGSRRYETVDRVHGHLGHFGAVPRQRVLLGLPRQSVARLVRPSAATSKGIRQRIAPVASPVFFYLF